MTKKRFLFVVPPLSGHLNPTISIGQGLIERGHEVAWAGRLDPLQRLLPPTARLFPLLNGVDEGHISELKSRFHSARGFSNLRLTWEDVFVPLTRAMLPGVLDAAQRFQPDVLISDQQTLAGALAARKLGLLWATTAVTPADRVVSLRWLPKVLAWTEERLADLQREIGLIPVDIPEDSPYLVLSFTTEALAGEGPRARPQYRYVGPALGRRDDDTAFPWDRLLPLPRILVSLGTLTSVPFRTISSLSPGCLSSSCWRGSIYWSPMAGIIRSARPWPWRDLSSSSP